MTRREQIVKQIEKVSKVYLPEGTKVFIFGSQANRVVGRNSDIVEFGDQEISGSRSDGHT